TFEVVISVASDIGLDDKVGAFLGLRAVIILRDGKALADDIENVFGATGFGPAASQADGDHAVCPHITHRFGGERVGKHAIYQKPAIHHHREKDAGISATGAYGIGKRAGAKHYAFAGSKVGCSDSERGSQLFE